MIVAGLFGLSMLMQVREQVTDPYAMFVHHCRDVFGTAIGMQARDAVDDSMVTAGTLAAQSTKLAAITAWSQTLPADAREAYECAIDQASRVLFSEPPNSPPHSTLPTPP